MAMNLHEARVPTVLQAHAILKTVSLGLGIEPAVSDASADWQKSSEHAVATFLRWHRLGQHFLNGMAGEGSDTRQEVLRQTLKKEVAASVKQNLFLSQTLISLCVALEQAEVPFVVLKGIPLSVEAFADPGVRLCRDIDLLIDPAHYESTEKVLKSLGLILEAKCRKSAFSMRRHFSYSEAWIGDGWLLDLHWGFGDQGQSFGVSVKQAIAQRRQLEVFGKSIPVLDWETQLFYLIHHAAKHLWLRFFWIVDVYALGKRLSESEWQHLAHRAQVLGMAKPFWFSLKLAVEVFGWTMPLSIPKARSEFLAETYLEWRRLALKDSRYIEKGVLDIPPKKVLAWSLKLADHWTTRASLLLSWVFKPSTSDITTLKLPKSCWFLYPVWRVIRLLLRSLAFSRR